MPGRPTPSPLGAPPALGPGATVTPLQLIADSDRSEWWHWWTYHRELYLDLDETLSLLHPATPGADGGRVERRRGLTPKVVYGRVVPAILEALAEEDDPRLVRQALLALGRIGEGPAELAAGQRSVDAIAARLGDARLEVAEGAVIALGALASPEAASLLGELLLDSARGRELCGERRVPARTRALAAYGLGVAGGADAPPAVRRYGVHVLARALAPDADLPHEVQAAVVIGLGLLPTAGVVHGDAQDAPPSASLAAQVRHLLGWLADDRQPEMVRAHAPTALARLLAVDPSLDAGLREDVVLALLDVVGTGRGSRERTSVERSAVVALGEIADADDDPLDREVRRRLAARLDRGDRPSRHFAAMALARIGGRPGSGERPLAAAREVQRELLQQLSRGKSGMRPWAGLALGVLGYHLREQGELLGREAADALLHAASTTRNPEEAAAHCLAVGLLGDGRASEALAEQLERIHAPGARAHVALGLGLLRSPKSAAALAALTEESLHRPEELESSALARALVGDRALVPDLLAAFDECACETSAMGIARGLAWSGDHRALTPLLAIATDGERGPRARAGAVEALGRIADRTNVPWYVRVSAGLNYIDAPSTLTDAHGFGILDTF